MASEENSKKIMEAIKRSRKIEYFVYGDLLVMTLAYLLNKIAKFGMDKSKIRSQIIDQTYNIMAVTFIVFLGVFGYQLEKVNQQLGKFFKLV